MSIYSTGLDNYLSKILLNKIPIEIIIPPQNEASITKLCKIKSNTIPVITCPAKINIVNLKAESCKAVKLHKNTIITPNIPPKYIQQFARLT